MIWWVLQPDLLRSERDAIVKLAEASEWLTICEWLPQSQFRIAVTVDIAHDGKTYPLKLVYPNYYPDTPPSIYVRDGVQISSHQYGPDGELCLEWRADNWDPRVTGAMMIESAYRLITGESSSGPVPQVPSAHHVSVGQKLRSSRARFLLKPSAQARLAQQPVGQLVALKLNEYLLRSGRATFLSTPKSIGEEEAQWVDAAVPADRPISGYALRLDAVPNLSTVEDAIALLQSHGHTQAANDLGGSDELALIVTDSTTSNLWTAYSSADGRSLLRYDTVQLSDDTGRRVDPTYSALGGKTVAVIGGGSLGSKIAASLARAGVGAFLLIDDDILDPGNLVRHELDWRAVGAHKVEGLDDHLRHINPAVKVDARRVNLGGQESAELTASILIEIAAADLVIDATANPKVFNLCATVCRSSKTPLLWGEVFAGGIGGLIARARPDFDPPPHSARLQIAAWCAQHGVPPGITVTTPYGGESTDEPLIADDGDVTAIAAQLSRLATDTLLRPTDSLFPQSVYLIGLKAGWKFAAPFHTFPIQYTPDRTWGVANSDNPDIAKDAFALLQELMPSLKPAPDANPASN